jgi:membrane protein YdbS with pleckstrin-like domain
MMDVVKENMMGAKQSVIDEQEIVYGTYRTHTMSVVGAVTTEVVFLIFLGVAAYFTNAVFLMYHITEQWQIWTVYGALAVLAAVMVVRIIKDYLAWYYTQVIVTNRRLIRREGILTRRVADIALSQLSEVVITQSLFGRMFNYGDVTVTGDSEASSLRFMQIQSPLKLRTVIDDARVGEKRATAPIPTEENKTPTNPLTIAPTVDLDQQEVLAQIDSLQRKGILTEAEAAAKRAQLNGEGR